MLAYHILLWYNIFISVIWRENMNNLQKLKGSLILMLTAIVWGSGFVAQSAGMELIEPNTFNGLRMLIGSLVLLPLALRAEKTDPKTKEKGNKKILVISAFLCGCVLCAASTIQTWGLKYTTSGNSGFITAMYMIFVPIISVFAGKKISARTFICALIALCGMYFLCLFGNDISINFGDALTLVCAVLFAVHILLIDKFIPDVNAVQFSSLQFFFCGLINIIIMFIMENPSFEIIKSCTVPILYSGLFACGIGYTLQPIGQKYAEPTAASIIMSLESVFALIFGILILHEAITVPQLFGCIIMFAAIILIQLPDKKDLNHEQK